MLLAALPLPAQAQRTPAEATQHAWDENQNACAQGKKECWTPTPRPTVAPVMPTLTPTPAPPPVSRETPTPEPEPVSTPEPCWATSESTDEAGDPVVEIVYYLDGTPMSCEAYAAYLAWLAAQEAPAPPEPLPQPASNATSVPTALPALAQAPPAQQVNYVYPPTQPAQNRPVEAPAAIPIRTSAPVATATMLPTHTPRPTLTPTPVKTATSVPSPRPDPTAYVPAPATWKGFRSPWTGFSFPTFHVKLPGWPPPPPSAETYWVAVLPSIARMPEPQVMFLLPPPKDSE
jgi:hypothetical protein